MRAKKKKKFRELEQNQYPKAPYEMQHENLHLILLAQICI